MLKVLLTGCNGLLGQKLIDELCMDPSISVIATARRKNRLPQDWDNYSFDTLDITNSAQVDEVLGRHKPDFVINTAAMTHVDDCELNQNECWTINVSAVKNLAESCEALNIHLIQISTDFVFDGSEGPLDEAALPNPINFYGKSKLAAEKLVRNSDINWTIIRTVLVYGVVKDRSRSNIVLWVKKNLEEGKEIKVVDDQWRTPTLAEDLAHGCILAIRKKAQGIFHISGKEFCTPYELANQIAEYYNLNENLIKGVDASIFSQPAKRPLKTGLIIEKARKMLGYEPHSFEEGLAIITKQLKN